MSNNTVPGGPDPVDVDALLRQGMTGQSIPPLPQKVRDKPVLLPRPLTRAMRKKGMAVFMKAEGKKADFNKANPGGFHRQLNATEKSVAWAKAFQAICPGRVGTLSTTNGERMGIDIPTPTPSINAAYDFTPFTSSPLLEKKLKSPGGLQVVHIPETQIASPLASNLMPQTLNDLREMLCGRDLPDGALNKTIPGNENDGWSGGVGWADVVSGRGLNKPQEDMWKGPSGNANDRLEKVTHGKQTDPYAEQKARERGEEIWESWKRAWDLWNGNYIKGRVNPVWIRSKYEELKAEMAEKKKRRGLRLSALLSGSSRRFSPRNLRNIRRPSGSAPARPTGGSGRGGGGPTGGQAGRRGRTAQKSAGGDRTSRGRSQTQTQPQARGQQQTQGEQGSALAEAFEMAKAASWTGQKTQTQQQTQAQRPLPTFNITSPSTSTTTASQTPRTKARLGGEAEGSRVRTPRPPRATTEPVEGMRPLPKAGNTALNTDSDDEETQSEAKAAKSVSFAAETIAPPTMAPQARMMVNMGTVEPPQRRTSPRKGAGLMPPPPPRPKKGGQKMWSPAMRLKSTPIQRAEDNLPGDQDYAPADQDTLPTGQNKGFFDHQSDVPSNVLRVLAAADPNISGQRFITPAQRQIAIDEWESTTKAVTELVAAAANLSSKEIETRLNPFNGEQRPLYKSVFMIDWAEKAYVQVLGAAKFRENAGKRKPLRGERKRARPSIREIMEGFFKETGIIDRPTVQEQLAGRNPTKVPKEERKSFHMSVTEYRACNKAVKNLEKDARGLSHKELERLNPRNADQKPKYTTKFSGEFLLAYTRWKELRVEAEEKEAPLTPAILPRKQRSTRASVDDDDNDAGAQLVPGSPSARPGFGQARRVADDDNINYDSEASSQLLSELLTSSTIPTAPSMVRPTKPSAPADRFMLYEQSVRGRLAAADPRKIPEGERMLDEQTVERWELCMLAVNNLALEAEGLSWVELEKLYPLNLDQQSKYKTEDETVWAHEEWEELRDLAKMKEMILEPPEETSDTRMIDPDTWVEVSGDEESRGISDALENMLKVAHMESEEDDDDNLQMGSSQNNAMFERSPSPEYPPPLGEREKTFESDGSSGGFIPMKELHEYKQPHEDVIMNSVWRPRRLGEEKLKIDIDEDIDDFHDNTDMEVDGGVDCGRSPYPMLRSVVKHYKKTDEDKTAAKIIEGLEQQQPVFPYLKRRLWDEVTGTIFNMPTIPEAGTKSIEEEEKSKAIHGDFFRDEKLAPHSQRHSLFPLDIRRCDRINPRNIDPDTNTPQRKVRAYDRDWPDELTEVTFDWENPVKSYRDKDQRDPWYVTEDQELCRDVPPRRYPPSSCVNESGHYLFLDETPWREEEERDIENESRYFVTNLEGGKLIINSQAVLHGEVAGPLPSFAIIETEGGQVSFWWGVEGREWGQGPDPTTSNIEIHWATLRRRPGWEYVGLSAGQVWERIILDRLHREQTGDPLADDDLWAEWKKAEDIPKNKPAPDNMLGGNVDLVQIMGGHSHDPDEVCDAACKQRLLNRPECFANEEEELEWLIRKGEPLSRAAFELQSSDQYRNIVLPAQASENFFQGPGNMPRTNSTEYQDYAQVLWNLRSPLILEQQKSLVDKLLMAVDDAEEDQRARIVTENNKRKAVADIGRLKPQKRQKKLLDDAKAPTDTADIAEAAFRKRIKMDEAAKQLLMKEALEKAEFMRKRNPQTDEEKAECEVQFEIEQLILQKTRERRFEDAQRKLRIQNLPLLEPPPPVIDPRIVRKYIAAKAQNGLDDQVKQAVVSKSDSDKRADAAVKRAEEEEKKRKAAEAAKLPSPTRKQQETQKRKLGFQEDVDTTKRQKVNQQAIDALLPTPSTTTAGGQGRLPPATPTRPPAPLPVAAPIPTAAPQGDAIPATLKTKRTRGLPTPAKRVGRPAKSVGPPAKPIGPPKLVLPRLKGKLPTSAKIQKPINVNKIIAKKAKETAKNTAGYTDAQIAKTNINDVNEDSDLQEAIMLSLGLTPGRQTQFTSDMVQIYNGIDPTASQMKAMGAKNKNDYAFQVAILRSMGNKGMSAVNGSSKGSARVKQAREAFKVRLKAARDNRAKALKDDGKKKIPAVTMKSLVLAESGGQTSDLEKHLRTLTSDIGLRAHVMTYVQNMIADATSRGVDILAERGHTDEFGLFNDAWNMLRAIYPNLDENSTDIDPESWSDLMIALKDFGQWPERINALPVPGRPIEDYEEIIDYGDGKKGIEL